jgi:hypothetical protein
VESKNATIFKHVFLFKKAQEYSSLKRRLKLTQVIIINQKMMKLSLEGVKRKKKTKIISPDFLIYLLENEHKTYLRYMETSGSCTQKYTIKV